MKKNILISILAVLGVAALVVVGVFSYRNLRGVIPAIFSPSEDIADIIDRQNNLPPGENLTDFPLSLPNGFTISVLARDLPNARDIVEDPRGNLWVSQPKESVVTLLQIEGGEVQSKNAILRDLNRPHGLAFDPNNPYLLYVAEEDAVSRVRTYSDGPMETLVDLPTGGRHYTRSLAFNSEGNVLVSIGSSCDTCYEENALRGTVQVLREGQNNTWTMSPHAIGLRNAVFMAVRPETGAVWVTEMGRDFLGDDLPPDEVNVVEQGGDYGWPICYGQNVHDTEFDTNEYIRDPCADKRPAHIDLPAHVAPLGLTFIPANSEWPEEYQGDLLVAYHGSWNRSEPVGYKIVRFDLDQQGNVLGEEDFISGWLTEDGRSLGRPVDLLAREDGTLFVSDDKAGLIYKVSYSVSGSGAAVTSFQGCVDAGNPVMESYPRQCRANGQTFTEDIGNELEKRDLIRIESPRPNTEIASPLEISGEARGTWYFEASFPIELRDANGNTIAEHYATAEGSWMTEDFVPFSATLEFTAPQTATGELILHKDNPSGLPEHDDMLRVPVEFSSGERSQNTSRAQDGCVISGCSGEVCSDSEVVTACIYKEEFACFEAAVCEQQASGECGWTQSAELTACLSQYE